MTEPRDHCACCDRELHPDRTVWLEMNWKGTFHRPEANEVPAEDSQGLHPFGRSCARKALKRE